MKVLIIGAGPVGLTLARLLSQVKVSTTVLERQPTLSTHPSAHFLHSSSMEVFHQLGISSKIRKQVKPLDHWRHFVYCSHLAGTVYRKHDHYSTARALKQQTLTRHPSTNIPQHRLLKILGEDLPSDIEVELEREFLSLKQGDSGVQVKCLNGEVYEADYLVACDGAGSRVRGVLDIPLEGDPNLQSFLNVHFYSKSLGEIAKQNPAMLYFVYNEDIVNVLVMHDADEGEFILQLPFYPSLQRPSDYSNSELCEMINRTASPTTSLTDVKISSVKLWRMSARYSLNMQKGRVFLAGDAAHQLSPAGGFGLNTGVGDAYNLYWKFAYPELLPTYSQERTLRTKYIIEASGQNYKKTVDIAKAFGLDLNYAKGFQTFAEWMPLGNVWFNYGMKLGQKVLLKDSNAKEYLAHEENLLQLLYPKEDLEYSYPQGFFAKGGGALAPNLKVSLEEKQVDFRELPKSVLEKQNKPLFVHLEGQKKAELPRHPVYTLPSPNTSSYVIRPDATLYSQTK